MKRMILVLAVRRRYNKQSLLYTLIYVDLWRLVSLSSINLTPAPKISRQIAFVPRRWLLLEYLASQTS